MKSGRLRSCCASRRATIARGKPRCDLLYCYKPSSLARSGEALRRVGSPDVQIESSSYSSPPTMSTAGLALERMRSTNCKNSESERSFAKPFQSLDSLTATSVLACAPNRLAANPEGAARAFHHPVDRLEVF